ncbi:MAG: hypothetical protein MZV70_72890 [Desulfobacterales bacterium]|nr:hypothetical protein [Desulfobacterales bacterium]
MKSWVPKKKPVHTTAHVKHPPKEQAPVSAKAAQPSQSPVQTPSPARKYLEEGEYQKAIDDYSAEYRKNPQNQALVKEYAKKGLDDMKTSADKASGKFDFASAGRIYSLLLGEHGQFQRVYPDAFFRQTPAEQETFALQANPFQSGISGIPQGEHQQGHNAVAGSPRHRPQQCGYQEGIENGPGAAEKPERHEIGRGGDHGRT